MIPPGGLIPLFVVYQLWGTGIRTNPAQDRLAEEFNQTVPQAQAAGSTTVAPALPGDATTPGSTPSPAVAVTGPPGTAPGGDAIAAPRPGASIGQITIPKIGADFYMVEGVDLNYLAEGPGHFPGTPFPGQAGNAALAGHRTTWKAPFNRIDELAPGDTITIKTVQGDFTYEVLPAEGAPPDTGYR